MLYIEFIGERHLKSYPNSYTEHKLYDIFLNTLIHILDTFICIELDSIVII